VGLREDEKAIENLEHAEDAGSIWMCWIKVDPKFDRLHGNPRFQKLLKKMHL
jgi:hypothetical protein